MAITKTSQFNTFFREVRKAINIGTSRGVGGVANEFVRQARRDAVVDTGFYRANIVRVAPGVEVKVARISTPGRTGSSGRTRDTLIDIVSERVVNVPSLHVSTRSSGEEVILFGAHYSSFVWNYHPDKHIPAIAGARANIVPYVCRAAARQLSTVGV